MFKEIGGLIGSAVGSVVGLGAAAVAEALNLPLEAVKKAMESGCTTYDDIRKYCKRGY